MVDMATSNLQEEDKNLERLRANVRELVSAHKEAQKEVDRVNAWIAKEGPSARYERWMNEQTEEQRSVRTRSDIAVSIIGLSIEDLRETIRDPPSVISIKDLMDTIDELDNKTSVESLGKALTLVEGTDASSLTDVFHDFETNYKCLSKEHTPRTTKILQTTHLAIRDLTDPTSRSENRFEALIRNLKEYGQGDQSNTSASTDASTSSNANDHQLLGVETTTEGTEHKLDALVPTQILNALSLYKYVHVMLNFAPADRVAEALRKLANDFKSGFESSKAKGNKEDEDLDVVLAGHKEASSKSEHVKAEHAALDDGSEIGRSGHRFETEDDHKSKRRRS